MGAQSQTITRPRTTGLACCHRPTKMHGLSYTRRKSISHVADCSARGDGGVGDDWNGVDDGRGGGISKGCDRTFEDRDDIDEDDSIIINDESCCLASLYA